MRKLLNTLYVNTPGSYLHREGETIKIEREGQTVMRLPIHTIEGIVCFGPVKVSPGLMGLCAERKVLLSYLSEYGQFYGRVQGPVSGNVLLRRTQYRWADDPVHSAAVAQSMVMAKIANSRVVLLRARREAAAGGEVFSSAIESLGGILERLLRKEFEVDSVRGIEGEAAREYFGVFNSLILHQKPEFTFRTRQRRPPPDPVNALLSFFYTLLAHECSAALESVGLDPYVGFLHSDRPGRASLALDLMEELRPVIVDRFVLSMINRKQVQIGDFQLLETGACVLKDDSRRAALKVWQERKQDEVRHAFLDETLPVGLIPYVQAMLLARHVRGDLDAYPALVTK